MYKCYCSPLVQEKLDLEKEAMDRIKQAQSHVRMAFIKVCIHVYFKYIFCG